MGDYKMSVDFSAGLNSLTEEKDIENLPVEGELPDWLRGSLFRNGPALFEAGNRRFNHLFDGQGMLHKFSFDDQGVSYRNRFIKSRGYRALKEKGEIVYEEFGSTPEWSFWQRLLPRLSEPLFSHNTLVGTMMLSGHLLTTTETPEPMELDFDSLETIGVFDYDDKLPGQVSTGHFLYDFRRGAFYNFTIEFGLRSYYHVYRIDQGSVTRKPLTSIPVSRPAYMHSLIQTDRHVILTECPFSANPLKVVTDRSPLIHKYRWRPAEGSRFIVIDKEDGSVASYSTMPFFCLHHINAFEDDRDIVIDLCSYRDPAIICELFLDSLTGENGGDLSCPRPYRYRIDTNTGKVSSKLLMNVDLELPRINHHCDNSRDYQRCYGMGRRFDTGADFFDQLVEMDVKERQCRFWFEDGCYPGEPVFASKPGICGPDDGVIMSLVLDAREKKSFLLVLDAADFAETARIRLPHHVPFGFHGEWFPLPQT